MASKHGSGRGRGHGRYRKQHKTDHVNKKEANVDESSPVIQAFRIFQKELDSRNDRHERIVKLSRDITIESKRIIFLLQRCAGLDEKESVLAEAATKFEELHATKFYSLALELEGQEPYQFLRAYSPGLQEYIEAVTFYHYLLNDHLVGVESIQSGLSFSKKNISDLKATIPLSGDGKDIDDSTSNDPTPLVPESHNIHIQTEQEPAGDSRLNVLVPQSEYMLGVADFTGELMRMAINSVGAGDLVTPALVTDVMRIIHSAFTTFNNTPREFRQKTRVLSQSLQKVEQACYTLKVRGSELPTHMLADVFASSRSSGPLDTFTTEDGDEQFE